MWGSAKRQSEELKADIEFDQMKTLCSLIQAFIALQLDPEYRDVEMWRVGHNLAASLTTFAISQNSATKLMTVAEGSLSEVDPNSASSVLMVFASPRSGP